MSQMQAVKYVLISNEFNKQKHEGCNGSDGSHKFHATWNWKVSHEDPGMHDQRLAKVLQTSKQKNPQNK